MSNEKLKPCPFCGGNGVASARTCDKNTPYNPNDRAYPVVRCAKCFTTVGGKDWSSVTTAIDAWNARADHVPAQPAVPDMDAIRQAVARGWCHPLTSRKAMDQTLAEAISEQVFAMLSATEDRKDE